MQYRLSQFKDVHAGEHRFYVQQILQGELFPHHTSQQPATTTFERRFRNRSGRFKGDAPRNNFYFTPKLYIAADLHLSTRHVDTKKFLVNAL